MCVVDRGALTRGGGLPVFSPKKKNKPMGVEIRQNGTHFIIEFDFHPKTLAEVKALPVKRYNPSDKSWSVPITQRQSIELFAKRTNAKFMDGIPEPLDAKFDVAPMPELTIDIPLKKELFPFQKQGVAYILEKKRLIIGDQPGLGKSAQAIAAIEAAQAFPCLIIAPSSLKINWQREVEMWTGKDAMILENKFKHNFQFYAETNYHQYFIVNYESLKKYFVDSINTPKGQALRLDHIKFNSTINLFKSVIIDESHRVKSMRTQQTKFTKGITNGKEYILALSGTPVINKPVDLVSQLGIIGRMPGMVGYTQFMNTFCGGPRQASNLRQLNQMLTANCFYRREKSDVMKDLPAKTRQRVICDITTRKEYEDAERDLENYLREYKQASDAQIRKSMKGEIMVRIGILKNISARGKIEALSEYIHDTIDSGEKLIVFAHLKEVVHAIKKDFHHAVTITGEDSQQERQAAVDKFQNDKNCKLIICSIKAAGVGITLTASSRVCFVELPWTFADCEQCEDRAHRIGQHDNVTCTYLLGDKTIDQKIYKIILEKKSIARDITGATDEVEENVISQLIDLFNQAA